MWALFFGCSGSLLWSTGFLWLQSRGSWAHALTLLRWAHYFADLVKTPEPWRRASCPGLQFFFVFCFFLLFPSDHLFPGTFCFCLFPVQFLPPPPALLPQSPALTPLPEQPSLLCLSTWHLTIAQSLKSEISRCRCILSHVEGLPRWLSGKESACQCRRHRRWGLDPCVGQIPWRRKWQPTPGFLDLDTTLLPCCSLKIEPQKYSCRTALVWMANDFHSHGNSDYT